MEASKSFAMTLASSAALPRIGHELNMLAAKGRGRKVLPNPTNHMNRRRVKSRFHVGLASASSVVVGLVESAIG